jgi:hypothetical protein
MPATKWNPTRENEKLVGWYTVAESFIFEDRSAETASTQVNCFVAPATYPVYQTGGFGASMNHVSLAGVVVSDCYENRGLNSRRTVRDELVGMDWDCRVAFYGFRAHEIERFTPLAETQKGGE